MTCALPGARTSAQARENAAAAALRPLDAATLAAVRRVYDEHIRGLVHAGWELRIGYASPEPAAST